MDIEKARILVDKLVARYKNPSPEVILNVFIVDPSSDVPLFEGPGVLQRGQPGSDQILLDKGWVAESDDTNVALGLKHYIAHYFGNEDGHGRKWAEAFRLLLRDGRFTPRQREEIVWRHAGYRDCVVRD